MDEQYEKLLKEMDDLMSKMNELKPGSEEYSNAAIAYQRLHESKMDYDNRDLENAQKTLEAELRKIELGIRQESISNEDKREKVKICVEIGGIVLPLAVYVICLRMGFKFEESGTLTSFFGRKHANSAKLKV